jgi:Proteolysis_6 C-terminal
VQVVSCCGNGSCWRHAAACSPNSGVFFLLQECTVLLVRGKRAAYFASPYVDAYGERHRQAR